MRFTLKKNGFFCKIQFRKKSPHLGKGGQKGRAEQEVKYACLSRAAIGLLGG
jgi:hypothetical protein